MNTQELSSTVFQRLSPFDGLLKTVFQPTYPAITHKLLEWLHDTFQNNGEKKFVRISYPPFDPILPIHLAFPLEDSSSATNPEIS